MPHRTTPPPPVTRRLSRAESLLPLRNVTYGRIVFVSRALPAIQLIPHAMDDGALLTGRAGPVADPEELGRALTRLRPWPGRPIKLSTCRMGTAEFGGAAFRPGARWAPGSRCRPLSRWRAGWFV
ncbi:hypothetical protein [Nonomuraea fuscirosea]|uniref:hypothetical protein n=1 Tax=Nonomuraea fuscirosea TaxID=1291556 RepID=UPI003428A081